MNGETWRVAALTMMDQETLRAAIGDVAKPFIGVYHAQWWSVPQHGDFIYAFYLCLTARFDEITFAAIGAATL